MNKKLSVYLAALTTVILWSMSYIWVDRLGKIGIPVEFFVPIRILLASGLLFLLNKILKLDMRIRRKDYKKFIFLALCMPFIYFVAETYGIFFTESPTISSLIIATNPIFSVAVALVFFKEKFSWINMLGVFVTLAGLWIVTYVQESAGPLFMLGIAILFVAVISEVSQIAFTKVLSDTYAPSVIVMYQFLFGSIFFMPLFFTKGIANFDASIYLGFDVIYPTLALALLCSATAFSLWAYAIKNLGVARISVFLAIVPLVTALLSFFFGDERLTLLQWIGLAIGMFGIFLTQYVQKKQ